MARTSHVAQPLGLVIFGKFKNFLTDLGRSTITHDLSETRKFMVITSLKSLHPALYPDYIISSFAKAGIVPFDRQVVLSNPHLCSSHLYLEQLSTTKRTRSSIDISGQILNSPAIITALRDNKDKIANKSKSSPPAKNAPSDLPRILKCPFSCCQRSSASPKVQGPVPAPKIPGQALFALHHLPAPTVGPPPLFTTL
jgi:hypothetical protein